MAATAFELLAKLSLETSEYEQKLESAENQAKKSTESTQKSFSATEKKAVGALSVMSGAVIAFATSNVKTGMEFDKSMSQVAATLGKTSDEVVNLRDFALEMGRTTKFSATEAAEGLNYMALAGYDDAKSMRMLPTVLNLAAAGTMELAKASDMVTDAQTAFGITEERTTLLIDEMAQTSRTSNTSVEQLGEAFLTVGGLARELNGGFVTLSDGTVVATDGLQEMEIALAAMANSSIKGSEAGTHMRNMLLKLASPTSDGTEMLEKLGVAVFDDAGQMRSLKDIMGDLSGALDELTQEEKIQAISELFNTRDLASAEALLAAVDSDWDAIGESILGAKGAAEEMAAVQIDNLSGDVTLMQSAFEGMQISLADALTPALRGVVEFLSTVFAKIAEIAAEDKFSPWIAGITTGLVAMGATAAGILAVNTGLTLMGTVLAFLAANPIVLIVAAIAGFVAALVTLYNKNEEFRYHVDYAWSEIKRVVKAVVDALVKFFTTTVPNALNVLKRKMTEVSQNMQKAWEEGAQKVIGAIEDMVSSIQKTISDLISKALSWGSDFIGGFAKGITDGIGAVTSAVGGIVESISSKLHFSRPDEGPLRDYEQWMPDMVYGLTTTLKSSSPYLIAEVDNLASGIESAFGNLNIQVGGNSGYTNRNTGFTQNVTINAPTELDPIETARELRNANREFILEMRG